jgi:hypothetical protein
MARYQRMHVSIFPLGDNELPKALAALRSHWVAPDQINKRMDNQVFFLEAGADVPVTSFADRQALAARISVAVWRAIGRYVKVVVDSSGDELDDDQLVIFNEKDYQRLMRTV